MWKFVKILVFKDENFSFSVKIWFLIIKILVWSWTFVKILVFKDDNFSFYVKMGDNFSF